MWFSETMRRFFFANIHQFQNLACIFESKFSQMSSKNFLRGYQLLQMNPMREIPEISIFAERKVSAMKFL